MKYLETFFDFIKSSTDAYNAVNTVKNRLLSAGYTELFEQDSWKLDDGGKYFVIRGGSSIIAFRYKADAAGFMMASAHTDSPTFKIKPSASTVGDYTRLDVEKYGGPILYTWLDKPLSVSGRIFVKTDSGIASHLVNIDRDLAVIPSVALAMMPEINSALTLNVAKDMQPLFAMLNSEKSLAAIVAEYAGVDESSLISHDLVLYNRQQPTLFGAENEFVLSPRIDDLSCAYCAVEGFLEADSSAAVPVLALFDNEEIGSETKQGAASTFLYDVLHRISKTEEDYLRHLAASFMVSIDVAHARHPAHPELSDPANSPLMNGGVVLKYNANQRYATDGEAAGLFKIVCERACVPTQSFTVRADKPCGSTLGHISATVVSVPTVDIGIPQLAMHSATETAGAKDVDYMISAMKEYYSASIKRSGSIATI